MSSTIVKQWYMLLRKPFSLKRPSVVATFSVKYNIIHNLEEIYPNQSCSSYQRAPQWLYSNTNIVRVLDSVLCFSLCGYFPVLVKLIDLFLAPVLVLLDYFLCVYKSWVLPKSLSIHSSFMLCSFIKKRFTLTSRLLRPSLLHDRD